MVLGVNHVHADVALRGELSLDDPSRLAAMYARLKCEPGFEGAVVLSTCNRTEIYTTDALPLERVAVLWGETVGILPGQFADAVYLHGGDVAVAHLFEVAAGLDAMVLGETEILGQVKAAYGVAQQYAVAGSLHRIFQAAFKAAKRAHAETAISQRALSLGYATRELATKIFGKDLPKRRVLVVGAGAMANKALRHLGDAGAEVTVVNRTAARAEALVAAAGGRAAPWAELPRLVAESDVVVCATRSPTVVIPAKWVRAAAALRRGVPWLFVDLAVPRNIAPAVGGVPGVLRYDLDDLDAVVQKNRARRATEVQAVREILREEAAHLARELDTMAVGPVIRSLRAKAEHIRSDELEALWRRLPDLSPAERAAVEQTTHRMLTKLLNDPMTSIRQWASVPDGPVYLDALRELFRLDAPSTQPQPD